jgi:arylsulfatase A-like enzyme
MSPTDHDTAGEPRRGSYTRIGAAVGLWTGAVLALLRFGVLFAMARLSHDEQPHLVWMRMAGIAVEATLVCLVVGIAGIVGIAMGGVLAPRLAARAGSKTAAWLTRAVAWMAATTLFALALTGRLSADRSLQVGLQTESGQLASFALLALAGVLASLAMLAARRAPHLVRHTASGLVAPLVVALALIVALRVFGADTRERNVVRQVVHELLLDANALEVVSAREDKPPHVAVLCPSTSFRLDAADTPALVLPPPARARLTLPASGGALWLRARAGVDRGSLGRPELAGARVRFEAALDGRECFRWDAELGPQRTADNNEWRPVGGAEGLAVAAGATLELRTRLLGADGAEIESSSPLLAGFGELTLERRTITPRARADEQRPNVVFIVMDTLRADRLSTYGYARPTSPNLDRLAARGLLFENALATSSWTWPSTASLFTGMLPLEHGVLDGSTCFLAHAHTTLAERLQQEGYTTAAWTANPLIVPDKNFDQGFESFDHRRGHFRSSVDFMPAVLDWIAQAADTRFFLYLHLVDPHVPHLPLPEGRARLAADVPNDYSRHALFENSELLFARERALRTGRAAPQFEVDPQLANHISQMYDACVWTGDYWLGRVLDTLENLGLDERTVVVFTSDHGEELLDHGFYGHGQSLHGELVHVPLVLAGPGVPVGVRSPHVLSNRHLAPTLARLAGTVLEGGGDGLDLARNPAVSAPVLLFTGQGWWKQRESVRLLGVRSGDLVLHFAPEGERRLYDLASDPHELTDLAPVRPVVVQRLEQWLLARSSALEAKRLAPAVPAGEATLEMLRKVGYLGD